MKRLTLLLSLLLAAATVSGQPAPRRATNLEALLAHPTFYHLRSIVVVGETRLQDNGEQRISHDGVSVRLVSKSAAADGLHEVRGEFWDLGRMNADDPRLAAMDVKNTFKIDPESAWPRPGEVTAIIVSDVQPAVQPAAPSVRSIVLYPSRYTDQRVTVTGQFGGRNLLGDLADAPGQSRYDFVLRSADAAIWVTNLRPRGKDFELALDARIDTGRWLEISGTLQQGRGLQWLDATTGTIKLTQAPKEPSDDAPIRVPAGPPPEVVFSTPTADETDVRVSTNIRIQFSRDINPSTFKGNITLKPNVPFTTQYLPGTRVLEMKLANPLDPFTAVTVELGEGVLGTDKQPLKPWTLTFETGS